MFSELYADTAATGLEALSNLDSNKDGLLTAVDVQFADVRIWRDLDQDGETDDGELITLAGAGITSIALQGTPGAGTVDGHNIIVSDSSFTWADGTIGAAADVGLFFGPTNYQKIGSSSGLTTYAAGDGAVAAIVETDTDFIIDMGQAGYSGVTGRAGNDQFYTTATGAIFANGGAGNDALTGGDGNDLLNGGAGTDQLFGGAGDDVLMIDAEDVMIDGGIGTDFAIVTTATGVSLDLGASGLEIVFGNDGDDTFVAAGNGPVIIDGSGGNDLITAGNGDDVLIGGGGNDTITGGNGEDSALFAGSAADYLITVWENTVTVQDLDPDTDGNDGTDFLVGMERLLFSDTVVHLDGSNNVPLAANETLTATVRGTEPLIIAPESLLANEVDFDGDALSVVAIGGSSNGIVRLDPNGTIVFTADAGFEGRASFEYTVADGHGGEATATAFIDVTQPLPDDPNYLYQWHLGAIGAEAVWDDYTGAGVKVGIVDEGVQYSHPDIVGNYDAASDYDYLAGDDDASDDPTLPTENHGTFLGGIIAGERNGIGVVGVAYDSTIAGYRIGLGPGNNPGGLPEGRAAALLAQSAVDVTNLSWGPLDRSSATDLIAALDASVTSGRSGLGTVFVAGVGNERMNFANGNDNAVANSRFTIGVAATSTLGNFADFSSPGANLLVTAPGVDIVSTDRYGELGYEGPEGVLGDEYSSQPGTSFSAPVVSGIVALMLEANPNLGYRDVQEILAYSAIQNDASNPNWDYNAARNWNGGGLHINHDHGFGMVNAFAAVRLAETWQAQSTRANELSVTADATPNTAITDNGTISSTVAVTQGLDIEYVEVSVDLSHTMVGDLIIKLFSPDGTESILLDRPGKDPNDPNSRGSDVDDIDYTFSTTRDWGEAGVGDWTLTVTDAASGEVGTLNSWTLRLFGAVQSDDDTYIFTNEFSQFLAPSDSARRNLIDGAGVDAINVAVVSTNVVIDLTPGAGSTIAGNVLTIGDTTVIENVFSGDGDDALVGNNSANLLVGGRGDDLLFGGLGPDELVGGLGIDTAAYAGSTVGVTVNLTANAGSGGEAEGDTFTGIENASGSDYDDTLTGDGADNVLTGQSGADSISGEAGNDQLIGGAGNDILIGGTGDDTLFGGAGDNSLSGGDGSDVAIYVGAQAEYTVSTDPGTGITTVVGALGTDTLTEVEFLRFTDGTVYIGGSNAAPTATADSLQTDEDTPITISVASLLANDTDADSDLLCIVSVRNPVNGSVEVSGDNVVFRPTADFSGAASFEYTVDDGKGGRSTATANITVTPVNDTPDGSPSLVVLTTSGQASGTLAATDVDSPLAGMTYALATAPANGAVTINPDGAYTYTPSGGYSGEDSFTFTVTDSAGAIGEGSVAVQVRGAPRFEQSFQVNATSRNPMGEDFWTMAPKVASLDDRGFVIVWASTTPDGIGYEVLGQRFDPGGNPIGAEFQVNEFNIADQDMAAVAGLPDGGFIVSWGSWSQDGSGYGTFARRFDATGVPVGSEFQVNTTNYHHQYTPTVTVKDDGSYVIAWSSYGQDGSDWGVFARRFDSQDAPLGTEFRVNTYVDDAQLFPRATVLADGKFVVTWESSLQDDNAHEVYAQIFNTDGSAQGDEFRVNSGVAYDQRWPHVTALADGGFIVVWTDGDLDPAPASSADITGRRFDSLGNAVGSEFRVNFGEYLDFQDRPSITELTDGGFVVVWQSQSDLSIKGQQFNSSGIPIESLFEVATHSVDEQVLPQVAALANGGFTVAWQASSSVGSATEVYSKVFGGSSDPNIATVNATGGDWNDALFGGSANDALEGGAGNDQISGGSGNDKLSGDAGNDILDGGVGTDIAHFRGNIADYAFDFSGAGTVSISNPLGSDGIDSLTNIETLAFDDITVGVGENGLLPIVKESWLVLAHDTFASGQLTADGTTGGSQGFTYSLGAAATHGSVNVNANGSFTYNPSTGYSGDDAFTYAVTNAAGDSVEALVSVRVRAERSTTYVQVNANSREPIGTNPWELAPSISALKDGNYVVVWANAIPGGSGREVLARMYDAGGNPISAEFQLNAQNADDQDLPVIAGLLDGGFIAAWTSWQGDTSGDGIIARRFDVRGNAVGSEFIVNTTINLSQYRPTIAVLDDGGYVVAWDTDQAANQDGDQRGVFAQRFDADDRRVGTEFQVNTTTTNWQYEPSITALTDGGFVIVWHSYSQDAPDTHGVYGQIYDRDGNEVANEFQINETGAYEQWRPTVTALADGAFAVVWEENDSGNWNVNARIFESSGVARTGEIPIAFGAQWEVWPTVTAKSDGGFVVLWADQISQSTKYSYVSAAGSVSGGAGYGGPGGFGDFLNMIPSVAELSPNTYAVAWQAAPSPGGNAEVYTQVIGSKNSVRFIGGVGSDNLVGGGSDDILFGQDGDDQFSGGQGNNILDGGSGEDTSDYSTQSFGVTVNLSTGTATGFFRSDMLTNIENVVGTSSADTITGDDNVNYFVGGGGNDTLTGGGGSDILDGGWAGGDIAVFNGAVGNYSIVENADGTLTVSTTTQADGTDILIDIEELSFNDGSLIRSGTNFQPFLRSDALSTAEDTPLSIAQSTLLANDFDLDGEAMSVTVVSNGTGGVATLESNGSITFAPDTNFFGQASFQYTVSDGAGGTATQSVSIQVAPMQDAPTAYDDALEGDSDSPLFMLPASLLANDIDVDGNSLSITSVGSPTNGTVQLDQSGNIVFTPFAGYVGSASFDYSVSDGNGGTDIGHVAVTVLPPATVPDTFRTTKNTPVTMLSADLALNDNADGDTFTLTAVGGAVNGSVSLNGSGNPIFTPTNGFTGVASFEYDAIDNANQEATERVTVVVAPSPQTTLVPVSSDTAASSGLDDRRPKIAAVVDGGYVATWHGVGNQFDIFVKRYDSSGNGIGSTIQVNQTTGNQQTLPTVATSNGAFVVAWDSYLQDGDDHGVYARWYDQNGQPTTGEILVNTTTSGGQSSPAAAALSDGSYIVVWLSNGVASGIYAQRFDSSGTKIGQQFKIDDFTWGLQNPTVTALSGGGFVVVWNRAASPNYSVYAKQFDADGNATTSQFRVNPTGTGNGSNQLSFSAVAALSDGGYVVAWQASNQDGSGSGIYAQRYSLTGQSIGTQFQANTYTTSGQGSPFVCGLDDDGFLIAWQSDGQDGSGQGVYAQRYDVAGDVVASEFQVNTTTLNNQLYPAIAQLLSGDIVFVWETKDEVRSRRYDVQENSLVTGTSSSESLVGNQIGNTLEGLAGSDILWALDGNDTLVGGTGDDTLYGGLGTDTYQISRGDGRDTIENHGDGESGDKVLFGNDIDRDQLWFSRVGDDLVVNIIGTNDEGTVDDWYFHVTSRVSRFEIADGSYLLESQVENLVSVMAAYAPPPLGQTELTTEQHQALDPVIAASWQSA